MAGFMIFMRAGLFTVVLYGVLWLVSSLWIGGHVRSIDTLRSLSDLYETDVREFVYKLPAFCREARTQRNLFIIGGSTANGYEPHILAERVPGWNVSRVALDFGNITQMRQSVQLLRACLGAEAIRSAKFVIAVSDVSFAPNKRRFPTPYTMLELEQLRHGLFSGRPGELKPVVDWRHLGVAVDAIRPVLLFHALVTEVSDGATNFRKMVGSFRRPPKLRSNEEAEAEELRASAALIGPSLDEQRSELSDLLRDIRSAGSDMLILQVPERQFVREGLPQYALYSETVRRFAREQNVTMLSNPADDADLRDGVHATRAGAVRWSERLGPDLAKALAARTPEPETINSSLGPAP